MHVYYYQSHLPAYVRDTHTRTRANANVFEWSMVSVAAVLDVVTVPLFMICVHYPRFYWPQMCHTRGET